MSALHSLLAAGDNVFHPRYGFGVVRGLARHDPSHPDKAAGPGLGQDYYDVQLSEGGSLLVPLERAESLGLRPLINGVQAVDTCLGSPAEKLPENNRQRAAALRERELMTTPTALAQAVRDLLAWCGGRRLAPGERTWLEKSCERLSAEAAVVDNMTMPQARAAIRESVNRWTVGV